MDTSPLHFFNEEIQVDLPKEHLLEKTPVCPVSFRWQNEVFYVETCLEEWVNFERRGKMARNMSPPHARHAALKGSWGVGRYYYRVIVQNQRIFEIYYDRAPVHAGERKGRWFLLGERKIP
jgi:hypothetical protein